MRSALLLLTTVLVAACAEPAPGGRVIYLNRAGATVTGGGDAAARNVSSLVDGRTVIAPTTMPDQAWSEVVACVQRAYVPFDVQIVDTRPTHDDFTMALFGGNGSELGLGADQHGIAPFSCDTVDDAVVFVFTDNLHDDVAEVCDVAVHEIAHTFSLDHQLLASAPTSYLPFTGARRFQDVDAPCGETEARACQCGGSTQNAFEILTDRLGLAPDADVEPPTVAVSAVVGARGSLAIKVNADDGTGVGAVTLHYRDGAQTFTSTCGDGRVSCTNFGGEYTFAVAGASGSAVFHAEVVDMFGNRVVTDEVTRPMS